jgi:hypothetical protein
MIDVNEFLKGLRDYPSSAEKLRLPSQVKEGTQTKQNKTYIHTQTKRERETERERQRQRQRQRQREIKYT